MQEAVQAQEGQEARRGITKWDRIYAKLLHQVRLACQTCFWVNMTLRQEHVLSVKRSTALGPVTTRRSDRMRSGVVRTYHALIMLGTMADVAAFPCIAHRNVVASPEPQPVLLCLAGELAVPARPWSAV